MLPPRILGLLVILLAVQGLCKPTKSTEDEDYEDDTPIDEEDEEDEDEETDNIDDAQPQILSHPTNFRERAGSTVILPCHIIHSENNAVAWMKDKEYLYFGSQAHIQDSKRIVRLPNNSLVIYNASVSDSSNNYTCIIFRQPNNIMITHRVLIDPERSSQSMHKGIHVVPANLVEVNQGESVTLGCETDMLPPPEMKWFIENKKVENYDPDVTLNDKYITIRKVNKSHSGRYQCLAEDGSDSPAMEAITVLVRSAPEIEVKRHVVHSGTGMESEMMCIVSAHPKATVTWYKDEKKIVQKKGLVIHEEETKGNKTKYYLKILRISARDFGEYKCHAQNFLGHASRSIILTGTPSQAKISGAKMTNDDTGIILKWHLQSYSPISEYKLRYRRIGDENWTVAEPEVKDGKGNQFIVEHPIENLQPGSYEAILLAKNVFGWSSPSESHMFTGDLPPEMARKDANSAAIRSPGILLAIILVVLSCAFTSL